MKNKKYTSVAVTPEVKKELNKVMTTIGKKMGNSETIKYLIDFYVNNLVGSGYIITFTKDNEEPTIKPITDFDKEGPMNRLKKFFFNNKNDEQQTNTE